MEQIREDIFPMEDALEMILVFDRSGKISYINAAARQKLEYGQELCGKYINEVFPNTFPIGKEIDETDYTPGNEIRSMVAYRKNHTCFPVEAKILKNESDFDEYICMANDILEKEFLGREIERIRQEADQAAKVKSEFVANVTHELRTPVNGILGNVRELLDSPLDEATRKSLHLVERCCDDMNKIINSILDFSKLEAGKFALEPRRFHFRNMMDYVKANHINKITEKGLNFFMTVSPQIPEYIIGDELRIVQILNNLISNAQKFTMIGKISVEVVKTAQVNNRIELFFIVSDTGIGIDQADMDKLFQSFSQVDASISRKYGGTGLGLNISKQLAELMGGRIEVESEKNQGSTFSFSIWVEAAEEDPGSQKASDDAAVFHSIPEGFGEDEDAFENTRKFGTKENLQVLERNMSKLILCVEMENWEKAEKFMEIVRQLMSEAPPEAKRMALRLKMAIQKEDYEKVSTAFDGLKSFL